MHGRGACMAGSMCGRGACMARGHAGQGGMQGRGCVAGGVHGRGHVWQGPSMQERWPLKQAVHILLECICVYYFEVLVRK